MATIAKQAQWDINKAIKDALKQDKQLTQFAAGYTGSLADQVKNQLASTAAAADQYTPATVFNDTSLEQRVRDEIAGRVGAIDATGRAQSNALANEIRDLSNATYGSLKASQSNLGRQRQEYGRYLSSIKPGMIDEHRQNLLADRLAQQELAISKQNADTAAMGAAGGGGGGGSDGPTNKESSQRVQDIINSVRQQWAASKPQKGNRTKSAYTMLSGTAGINKGTAAYYAMLWSGEGYHRNRGTVRTMRFLRQIGVPNAAVKYALDKLFGAGSYKKADELLRKNTGSSSVNNSNGTTTTTSNGVTTTHGTV